MRANNGNIMASCIQYINDYKSHLSGRIEIIDQMFVWKVF